MLCVGAVTCLLQSCILAPPPLEAAAPPVSLAVDLALVKPAGSKPLSLERKPTAEQEFSVTSALSGDSSRVNKYWYVDFDPQTPTFERTRADPFVLKGCDDKLSAPPDPRTAVVEVLLTLGEIILDSSRPGDPRVTKGGEEIRSVRWTVVLSGTNDACKATP